MVWVAICQPSYRPLYETKTTSQWLGLSPRYSSVLLLAGLRRWRAWNALLALPGPFYPGERLIDAREDEVAKAS